MDVLSYSKVGSAEREEREMNCFNHRERPALGLCKSCGKGLCEDCLIEVPNGLACRNKCEERANCINAIADRNKNPVAAALYLARYLTMFLLAVGCFMFLCANFQEIVRSRMLYGFLVVIALVCLLLALPRLGKKGSYPKP
jgi:hypothetical protein